MHAEIGEAMRDGQLVLDRKRDVFPLRAVPQRGVVKKDRSHEWNRKDEIRAPDMLAKAPRRTMRLPQSKPARPAQPQRWVDESRPMQD
jgi:hypothetical protein